MEALTVKKWLAPMVVAILALVCVQAHATLGMLGGIANGVSATWFGATLPTAPTTFTTVSSPPSAGSTCNGSYFTPSTAATIQTAINSAAANVCANGDVIEIPPGTYQITSAGACNTGSACFNIPAHSGGWIYIISSHAPDVGGTGLPSAGTRICPSGMPGTGATLIGCPGGSNSSLSDFVVLETNDTSVGCREVQFAPNANYYRFVGIDFQCLDSNGSSRGSNAYVIYMGNSTATSATGLPTHITFDRCYISGSPTYGASKGIWDADGSYLEFTESYFWNIFAPGNADSNAIWGLNGPGPIKITDNSIYADGEETFFGGDNITIQNALYGDIDIEHNHYWKPLFTGTVTTNATTTIHVTAVTSGILMPPMKVTDAANDLPDPTCSVVCTTVIAQLTGTSGATCPDTTCNGTTGTYQISAAATGSHAGTTLTGVPVGKNMLEFKEGQRIKVFQNFFENAGGEGQPRSGMTSTVVNQYGPYEATGSQTGTSLTISAVSQGELCNGQTITFTGGVTATVTGISGGCTLGTGTFTGSPSQIVSAGTTLTGPSTNWVAITDLDVEQNVWTNMQFGGMNWLLQDSAAATGVGEGGDSQVAQRWLFRNDLFILNKDDMTSGTSMLGVSSNAPGNGNCSGQGGGGGGNDIILDHITMVPANGSSPGIFFGPGSTGCSNLALSRVVFTNDIFGVMDYKFGSATSSQGGYTQAITNQVTQPAFQQDVFAGVVDAAYPANTYNPSTNSAIGFTSFGSATAAAGYALTSGSPYHAIGVSGLNLPYNSPGTSDGSDLGANISLLPTN